MTLIFTSVTYALKALRLLADHHIHTTLTRSPAVTAVRGCGYGLRLADPSRLEEAKRILERQGVYSLGAVKEG
ncbi:MAG: DUF3343 domain-containing protein [Clostridia bacterium]|nr:DUF3343 domain-containing protein [Clostridia bacterium]